MSRRLDAFRFRNVWWRWLDRWETKRSFRWLSIGFLAVALLAVAAALWAYPWWMRRNSVKTAREWLAAGRINYAVEAIQQAIQLDPKNPAPWQIAAEIARIRGQKSKAMDYAHHAASLEPGNADLAIAWAAEALRADSLVDAKEALTTVPAVVLEKSPDAQRSLGEMARRNLQLDDAQKHFETALRIDGPVAVDEVPLGLILLNAKDPAQRQRGLGLLEHWTGDREWGVVVLRTLVADARSHDDRGAQLKWAEALRANPSFTNGDMPDYLAVLSQIAPVKFTEVIASMEKDHATSPEAATRLLSWLNQIGRSNEAVRWMKTLPAAAMRRPPLVVGGAEALRQTADWPALQAWTHGESWGTDADFLRWAYGMQAARMLGNETEARELWLTLYNHAQLNGVHALFAGSMLYSWGLETDAEALWWRAAEQEGPTAIDALGSLARHYQTHRDAEGQYRVFRHLHLLHPHDAAAGNNFSFFAALTGRDQRLAERVARENLAGEPKNEIYAATLAFNLFMQGKPAESLAVLKPHTGKISQSPVLSFAYGLALAGTGEKAEAHKLLDRIAANAPTKSETELIRAALAN
ncbi:MAG TPA: hypothetical protein VGM64_13540 [Lacunisphaera sp.]|jgi:predicted Zn-dependent protease